MFPFSSAELRVRFRRDSSPAQWDSELFFQQRWQFRDSGKLIQPAGAAKTLLPEMGVKVRESNFNSP